MRRGERIIVIAVLPIHVEAPARQMSLAQLPGPVLFQIEETKVVVAVHVATGGVVDAIRIALLIDGGDGHQSVHLQRIRPAVIELEPQMRGAGPCRPNRCRRLSSVMNLRSSSLISSRAASELRSPISKSDGAEHIGVARRELLVVGHHALGEHVEKSAPRGQQPRAAIPGESAGGAAVGAHETDAEAVPVFVIGRRTPGSAGRPRRSCSRRIPRSCRR